MAEWNEHDFSSIVASPIDYSVVMGKPLSGKTFVASAL